jgi:hypothetical protein
MLFVPLAGGESHTPLEDATDADIALAGRVLIDLLSSTIETARERVGSG